MLNPPDLFLFIVLIVEPVTVSPKGFLEGFGGRFPPLLLLGFRHMGILLTVVDELQIGVDVASKSHQLVVRFTGARENMQVLLIDFATYLPSLSLWLRAAFFHTTKTLHWIKI